MKTIIFLLLALASIILLCFLVYALVYANAGSVFWKNRFVIGLAFMAATRFAIMAYRRYQTKQPV